MVVDCTGQAPKRGVRAPSLCRSVVVVRSPLSHLTNRSWNDSSESAMKCFVETVVDACGFVEGVGGGPFLCTFFSVDNLAWREGSGRVSRAVPHVMIRPIIPGISVSNIRVSISGLSRPQVTQRFSEWVLPVTLNMSA